MTPARRLASTERCRFGAWACQLLTVAFGVAAGGCFSPAVRVTPVYFPSPPAEPRVVHLISFNDLTSLVPAERSWLEIFQGVAPSPHVVTPAGVAFRAGCLYVCDIGSNVVHRWDLRTGEAKVFGGGGGARLVKPVDVAVDGRGNVFVADAERGEVVSFAASGKVMQALKPADRPAYRPVAVAVQGARLYVADIAAHRIDVLSVNDGGVLDSMGGIGADAGQFHFPMGVSLMNDGTLLVADMMNSRVQVFDAQLRPVLSFGRPGNRYGDMGKPKRVAVGPDGVVFVADVDFAYVHLFDIQGRLLMLLGGPGEGPGFTPMPAGVTVANTLPPGIVALVPADFRADYFLFVSNTVGEKRISLYAVGARSAAARVELRIEN